MSVTELPNCICNGVYFKHLILIYPSHLLLHSGSQRLLELIPATAVSLEIKTAGS